MEGPPGPGGGYHGQGHGQAQRERRGGGGGRGRGGHQYYNRGRRGRGGGPQNNNNIQEQRQHQPAGENGEAPGNDIPQDPPAGQGQGLQPNQLENARGGGQAQGQMRGREPGRGHGRQGPEQNRNHNRNHPRGHGHDQGQFIHRGGHHRRGHYQNPNEFQDKHGYGYGGYFNQREGHQYRENFAGAGDRGQGQGQGYAGQNRNRRRNQDRNQTEIGAGDGSNNGNNRNVVDSSEDSDDSQFSSTSSRYEDKNSNGQFLSTLPEARDALMKYLVKNKKRWNSILSTTSPNPNDKNTTSNSDETLSEIIHVLGERICIEVEKDGIEIVQAQNTIISAAFESKSLGSNIVGKCHRMIKVKKGNAKANVANGEGDLAESLRFLRNLYNFLYFTFERFQDTSVDFLKQVIAPAIKVINHSQQQQLTPEIEPAPDPALILVLDSLKKDFEEFRDMIREITGEVVTITTGENTEKDESKKQGPQVSTEKEKPPKGRPSNFFFTPKEEEALHARDPPEDFRSIPIIPTIEEILTPDESFLRPNLTAGAYRNANHYLDVQFRLLREDFLRPLKNGIQEFLKNKREYLSRRKRMPFGTVRLYQNIKIVNVELVRETVMYTLQMQEEDYARVKWERSRRLLNGSLLLFTADNFKSTYFGIIGRRDPDELKAKGIFGITWEGPTKPDFSKKNQEFLMFESECFFEAYRHTLQVMKDIPLDEFPMAKYIVESSADVGPPAYLRESLDMMKIGESYVDPLGEDWPNAEELGLDPTQFSAYKAALTKEFAIVQGPPGTGKTFLGLKVVETLLRNPQHWWHSEQNYVEGQSGPILVVCLTNHALDQFLEGILKLLRMLEPNEDPGLIRVGGRFKSEALEEFSLARRRMAANKMHLHSHAYKTEKNKAWRAVNDLQSERSDLMSEYLGLANPAGIVRFSSLSIWRSRTLRIAYEFRESFWDDFIHNPTWYGLNRQEFENKDFNVDRFINQNFRIRENQRPKDKPRNIRPLMQDEEDYDLEELQANRIMDDVYYMAESKSKGRGEQNHSKDLNYSISIPSLGKMIQSQEKSKREDRQGGYYRQSSTSITKIQNQRNFLQTFLKLVEEGLVIFPYLDYADICNYLINVRPTPAIAWAIYFQIVEVSRTLLAQSLADLDTKLVAAQKELQRVQRQGDGILLQMTKVVGMTTTAASKASDLLKIMKSKIVIVEEAAEVLEAHVINCITQHCEHLIMIGDHQQLRPNIAVLELASKYHLNISLFERMVNNKLNCYKLLVQHRMRAEISDLVRGSIYNELEDHSSVLEFGNIMGMAKNLFFITHKYQESSDSDSVTKTNTHEAKFLVALCKHLMLQGYSPSQITILATYTGQMFLIKKELSHVGICKGVHVTAVDNFQGEENHIILLSLVRSNSDNNVGFLKVDNRICVALSRAKHGLYIIGNMEGLVASSPTWKTIQEKLIDRGEIGDALPLICATHGTMSKVGNPSDFGAKYPEGGCSLPCGALLPDCAHPCKAICHPKGRDHKDRKCTRPCERVCPSGGHKCPGKCFQPCKPCPIKVVKTLTSCGHEVKTECHQNVENIMCKVQVLKRLPCGHESELPCHTSVHSVQCEEMVTKKLPSCGHAHDMKCYEDPKTYKCMEKVDKILTCGHKVENVECWKDMADYTCTQSVAKLLPECGHTQMAPCCASPAMIRCNTIVSRTFPYCTHKMEVKCYQKDDPMVCRMPCNIRIRCGHQCTRICHPNEDKSHSFYKCEKTCVRNCKNGHPCKTKHKCSEPCQPCEIPTDKYFQCKIHKKLVRCYASLGDSTICPHPCNRKHAGCKHECKGLCREFPCPPCQVTVTKMSSCGHEQSVPCSGKAEPGKCMTMVKNFSKAGCGHFSQVPCRLLNLVSRDESTKFCSHPCGFQFEESEGGCGHTCKGTCSECLQGRIHKKCGEECGRSLVCGHVCTFPCAEVCPPCVKSCGMKCDHSQCTRKCGEPCNDCAEPCTWKCEHKKCTKLCREICNRGPCDEPCKKFIRCGHPCIGLCGEPCPPLCRICDPEKLTEFIILGNEEEPDSRFVYLEDCRHCIEVEAMDTYMTTESDEGGIQAKTCPRCKTLIRHSKRYGNILRKRLEDVMKVKRLVFGNAKEITKSQDTMISELLSGESPGSAWSKYLPKFRKEMFDKIAEIVLAGGFLGIGRKEKIVPKVLDQYEWRSIELMVKHGKDSLFLLSEAEREVSPVLKSDLAQKYVQLFEHLSRRILPLSKMEMKSFDCEFERLFDLKQIYRRKSSYAFRFEVQDSRVNVLYEIAKGILFSAKAYGASQKIEFRSLLKKIDELLGNGLGISEREKREVIAAMGMRQGHWYKCPNGHVYVITECGGAMVEGKCNECGAKIGGGRHRLRGDNQLATEMDGARGPAWPTNLLGRN